MRYWIGQGFGLVATAAGISIPLLNKKWKMLVMSIANNVFLALNLVFLDAIGSGIFLFIVGATQGVVNLIHSLRDTQGGKIEKAIFMILYLGLGFYGLFTAPGFVPAVNRQNLIELLPIAAAMMNMFFVSARKERTARTFFVVCNSLWSIYDVIIWSSAFFGAFISVVTGVIALIKNREKKTPTSQN